MRVPFPEKIPLRYVVGLACLLAIFQQLQSTSILFTVCSFLFVVIAGLAFNLAEGFRFPSGAYVFFFSTLGVIVGLIYKAVLWEPAQSNLLQPDKTIEVFLGSISSMYGAVWLSRRFRRKQALLQNTVSDANIGNAVLGCLVVGSVMQVLPFLVDVQPGSILSALVQLNRFLPMAVILGVTQQIRRTGGRSSVNFAVLLAGSLTFLLGGVFGFSKEGMFTPFLCWFLAAGAQQYRLRIPTIVALSVMMFLLFRYMVPYSQYGRVLVTSRAIPEKIEIAEKLLSDPEEAAKRGENTGVGS